MDIVGVRSDFIPVRPFDVPSSLAHFILVAAPAVICEKLPLAATAPLP